MYSGTRKCLKSTWKPLLTAFVLLALLGGCHHDPTVWRTELLSPDGAWLATAHTDQYGGFGSAYVVTVVSLTKRNRTVNRGKPFDVLEYPDGGPIRNSYALSEENAGGGVDLKMKWTDTSHLEIDYSGTIDPSLQVVRFAGVDISLHRR